MIGARIADRYEVLDFLGRGGFGQVFRAKDHELGREVALKFVSDDGSQSLRDEAGVLARFNHPGLVTVHDFGDHEGRLYLVMELVSGSTLAAVVDDGVDTGRSVELGILIGEAMSYAHEQGVAHRDLNLQNIMLMATGPESGIKIIDFGLGEADSDGDLGGVTMGTPRYMAPEQFRGIRADGKTDFYAFGVCMYRMLAGRYPFEGEHRAALEFSVLNEDPPHVGHDLPPDLAGLVMQCLAKEPADRPSGFPEIAQRLSSVDLGGGISQDSVPEIRNPYLIRVMIQDPADFYGRKREIRKIFARLDAPQPQSISMVGDRRIGKSSLLNHVYNEGVRHRHMSQADQSVFVFMDFQSNVCGNTSGFLDLLIKGLPAECKGGRTGNGEPDFSDFEKAVSVLDGQGRRLLVLMDEFERITNNAAFEQSFFSNLRSVANRFKVAYVTSSSAELQDLCHTREISDSPFFNIFSNLPLGPFRLETAADLIAGPSEREGMPLAEYTDRLVAMAGLRPMNLQIACSCLFEEVVGSDGGHVDWSEVERNYLQEINPHFEFVWKRLTDQERENLSRLAAGRDADRQHEHLNEEMRKRGLVAQDGSQLRVESESFRDFIVRQAPRSKGSWLSRLIGRGR